MDTLRIRFLVELERAIANQLNKTTSLIINEIIRNSSSPSLLHSDFDNFDQYINDEKGEGSIHTADRIMLQEVIYQTRKIVGDLPQMKRTKGRSINVSINDELPECFVTKRKSPATTIARQNHQIDKSTFEVSHS